MRERINKIRTLLGELEQEAESRSATAERALVSGLELPDIMRDVVDLLMPELKPYEIALYMYFLRHSIIADGTPYLRTSRYGLQPGVVKSAYAAQTTGGSGKMSYAAIQQAMTGLEAIGAIRQEGDPNRVGTLYRILLPEEIEVYQRRRAEQSERSTIIATEGEADFYNVRENRLKVYERDNYHCRYCQKQLTRFIATLDHVHPVAEGGDNSLGNLVTACLDCNSRKNVRLIGDFLAER